MHVVINEKPTKNHSLLLILYSNENISHIKKYLKHKHTSGMIIFSAQNKYIDPAIIELAHNVKKPLIYLISEDENIVYDKVRQVLQMHDLDLQHLLNSDLSTYWLDLFNERDIQHVIQRFSILLGEQVYYFNSKNQFIPISKLDSPIEDLVELKKRKHFPHRLSNQFSTGYCGIDEYCLYSFIDKNNKSIGYFLFKKNQHLSSGQINMFKTVTSIISTWQAQLSLTKNIHLKYKDQFMFDILNNNIETESEIIELCRLWDIQLFPNTFVLVIDLKSKERITKAIQLNMQKLLIETNTLPINIQTTYIRQRIVAIMIPTDDSKIKKEDIVKWSYNVRNEFLKYTRNIQTIFGIGRPHFSSVDIYKSFQEAKIALQMYHYTPETKGVIHYEDIGYIRLLSYIHSDLLDDFSDQYLGKLEKYDKENDTNFVETLYTYCNSNGDIIISADALYIHQNTLRKRLKRIEAILDIQLNYYSDLVNLIIALKISIDMD